MLGERTDNDSICDSYLERLGYRRVQGKTVEPILPALVLDLNYQIFNKVVRQMNCRNEMKMLRNKWLQSYRSFNKQFFSSFSSVQTDDIIQRMDDLEEYIKDDVLRVKIQMMNLLDDLDLKEQEVCSELVMANIFAQVADLVWRHCFKTASYQDSINPHILSVERSSSQFMKRYHSAISNRSVNPNESVQMSRAVSVLCRKLIGYLYKDEPEKRRPNIRLKGEK